MLREDMRRSEQEIAADVHRLFQYDRDFTGCLPTIRQTNPDPGVRPRPPTQGTKDRNGTNMNIKL